MLSFRRNARLTLSAFCALVACTSVLFALPARAENVSTQVENIETISVGEHPVAIATYVDGNSASSDTDRIFVANYDSGTVTVINTASRGVIKTVPVSGSPIGIAVDPSNGTIYVVSDEGIGNGTLTTIDPLSYTITSTLTIGRSPRGVTVDPIMGRIYVTLRKGTAAAIDVIDPHKNEVTDRLANLGERPEAIAINPHTRKAFIANGGSNDVSIVNLRDLTEEAVHLPVEQWPVAVCSTTFEGLVYVANEGSDTISVISGRDNALVDTIKVGREPRAIVESSPSLPNRLFVANRADNSVSVISSASRQVEATVTVGSAPEAIAADVERHEVYVVNSASNTISIIR